MEQRILDKLDEIQKSVHSIDSRLVRMETKIKMAVPVLSLIILAVFDFLKVKVFGMKG